jgi:hypothetical protein
LKKIFPRPWTIYNILLAQIMSKEKAGSLYQVTIMLCKREFGKDSKKNFAVKENAFVSFFIILSVHVEYAK